MTLELGPLTVRDHLGVKQPIDLTLGGTKVWLTVKAALEDADPGVIQLTELSGITLNSPVTAERNFLTAFIPEATFASAVTYPKRTKLFWDLVYERGTRHEGIGRGHIFVVPRPTRAT